MVYRNDDCAALDVTRQADPDPVYAGSPLTYTMRVTNAGDVDLHATVTDTLSVQVSPSGVLTWTPTIPVDGVWTQQVAVTVTEGYSGTLTNLVQVVSSEGVTGNATVISQARTEERWDIYLPLVLRNPPQKNGRRQ